MPIHPNGYTRSAGDPQGVASMLMDVQRRLRALESSRTVVGALDGSDVTNINGANIQPNTIDGSISIKNGTITASQILAGTITGSLIQANAITSSHIQAGAIQADDIAAHTISAAQIAAGAITANEIAANAVTAGAIQAATITADKIAAGSITGDRIAADTITAREIIGTTLSAITSDLGAITAGTITGGTVQTATSGSRVVLSSAGLSGYALDGVTKTFDINTGTGLASFTGVATLNASSVVPATTLSGFIGGGNLLRDSSFESSDPGMPGNAWTLNGVTQAISSTQAFHGTKSLAVTRAGAATDAFSYTGTQFSDALGITLANVKSKPTVFSAWVYVPAATKSSGLISGGPDRSVMAYDGVGSSTAAINNIPADTWTRVSAKLTFAATANVIQLRLYNPFNTGPVYYDGVQFELGDAPTAYGPSPSEVTYGSIKSLQIGAGEVTANNIKAGAVTAQSISVAMPGQVVNLNNGNFAQDIAGAAPTSWTITNAPTVASDTTFTKVLRMGNTGTTTATQSVTLPTGRHVVTVWVTTSGVTGTGAALSLTAGSGYTINSQPTAVNGTSNWILQQAVVTVTAGSATVPIVLASTQTAGTTWFANANIQSSIGSTLITPNSITTNEIATNTIKSTNMYAGTIQADLIQGTNIAAGAINADKISVGANTDNLVINGSFEDNAGEASLPAAWYKTVEGGWYMYGATANGANVASGKWELAIPAGNNSIASQKIPVVPGQKYRVRAVLRHDNATNTVFFRLNESTTGVTANYVTDTNRNSLTDLIAGTAIPTTNTTYEFTYTAPAGVRYVSVCFYNWTAAVSGSGDNAAPFLRVDDVQMERLVTGTLITPGTISTTHLAANSITADKINFNLSQRNLLKNSRWDYWDAAGTFPDSWTSYDNGGSSTSTWSRGTGGVPLIGTYSWRLFVTTAATGNNNKGFRYADGTGTAGRFKFRGGVTYIMSWWWAGQGQPQLAWNNAPTADATWMENPTVQPSTYQRYSMRLRWNADTEDYIYIYTPAVTDPSTTRDMYLAGAMLAEADAPAPWSQYIDPTVIDGSTITGATIRTNATTSRLQMDDNNGFHVWNSGVITAMMKAGQGGLDLTASTATTVPGERTIRWLESVPGGLVVADIKAYRTSLTSQVMLRANQKAPTTAANAVLSSFDSTGRDVTLTCTHDGSNAAGGSYVSVQATGPGGTAGAVILNSDGQSDFMKKSETKYCEHTGASIALANSGTVQNFNNSIQIITRATSSETWMFMANALFRSDSANDTYVRAWIYDITANAEIGVGFVERLYYGSNSLAGFHTCHMQGRYTIPANTTRTITVRSQAQGFAIGAVAYDGGATHNNLFAWRVG